MTNSSVPGRLVHEFYILCRNITKTTNSTKAGTAEQLNADTDFGAVLYIVVVLTFYSFGIVVMIVKYLKTEQKEMEEEMVLDSFFKGIPDKRIQTEKEAVNRVAIQAFHTLTTSKQPRCMPQSTTSHDRNQDNALLSPSEYRRERYSIQPMYIETPRQMDEDGENCGGDDDDDEGDNDNEDNGDNLVNSGPKRVKHNYSLENEIECEALCLTAEPNEERIKSKPHKSVLFSDVVNPQDIRYDKNKYNGRVRDKATGSNSKRSMASKTNLCEASGQTLVGSVPQIQLMDYPADLPDNGTNFRNSSKLATTTTAAAVTVADSHSVQSNPLKTASSSSANKPKNLNKGFLSARKASSKGLTTRPFDSPDLGIKRDAIRMSALEKGTGDGSSYDSSSSLLTRIHLADSITPPSRPKTLHKTPSHNSPSVSGICLPNSTEDSNGASCSSNISHPLYDKGDRDIKSNEKLKLTVGKTAPSMQPSYDSTSSCTGLTTRVNILDPGGQSRGGKTCLVTDL